MFSTEELAALRSTLEQTFPETVLIKQLTRATDGAGGSTATWATLATTVARVSPSDVQSAETTAGEKTGTRQRWTITLPAETTITAKHRIVWGTRTFEIVGVGAARSDELCVRVSAMEVL